MRKYIYVYASGIINYSKFNYSIDPCLIFENY